MKKTNIDESGRKITVTINELQNMLCVGRNSANSIGVAAGAVIRFGRRKLYNVDKVQNYLDSLSN